MRSFACSACGTVHMLPDVNRCPFCHCDLFVHSDEHARKHCRRCAVSLNPRQYSDRGPGRPSKKEVAAELGVEPFRRHCRNCGRPRCQGSDDGICGDWEPQSVGRCPFCGRVPVEVGVGGVYAVICDACNVKMTDDDRNRLISRWNRTG